MTDSQNTEAREALVQVAKSENTELWDLVFKTDPRHVKPITGKTYKGNSPKPYWVVGKATEIFGPCGIGWGVEVMDERFEKMGGDEILHVARVKVWYEWKGKRGEIQQMGQTRAAYKSADKVNEQTGEITPGRLIVDEDAPKKSVTDGMVKALSLIGFTGDIFSGRWDDSKYMAELRREFSEAPQGAGNAPQGNRQQQRQAQAQAPRQQPQAPTGDYPPGLSPEEITGNRQAPRTMPNNATLGDAEFREVNRLLDLCRGDKAAFAAHFGAQSVAGIPLAKYAEAVGILKTRIRKQREAMEKSGQIGGDDPGAMYDPALDPDNRASPDNY